MGNPLGKWPVKPVELFFISILITLVVLSVQLLDSQLDRKMSLLKEEAVNILEMRLGRKITYQSISPSILGFLAVRELKIYSSAPEGSVLLQINRLKIKYNILKLIFKRNIAGSLSEIQISNSNFDFDAQRDREIFKLLRDLTTGQKEKEQTIALKLSGRSINVRFRSGKREFRLSKLFFTLAAQKDYLKLTFRCFAEVNTSSDFNRGLRITSRVKLNGKLDPALSWADMSVRIYSLNTPDFILGRQTFQLTYREKILEIRKIQDRAPIDLWLIFDVEQRQLVFKFNSDKFTPASKLQFSGRLDYFNRFLNSSLTAAGSIEYNLENGKVSYLLDLQMYLKDGFLPGKIGGEINLVTHLNGNERILYLKPLLLHSRLGSMEFFGNILLQNMYPAGFLHLMNVRTLSGESLNAALQVVRESQSLTIRGHRLNIGSNHFSGFELKLKPLLNSIIFDLTTNLTNSIKGNSIKSHGELIIKPEFSLKSSISVKNIPVFTVYQLFFKGFSIPPPLKRIAAELSLTTDLTLVTDFKEVTLVSDAFHLEDSHNQDNSIDLTFKVDNRGIAVPDFRIYWNDYEVQGDFVSERELSGISTIKSTFRVEEIPYSFEALHVPGKWLEIIGSYNLNAFLNLAETFPPSSALTELKGRSLGISMYRLPIPIKGQNQVMYCNLDLKGIITNRGRVYLEPSTIELFDLPLGESGENRLKIAFSLQGDSLELEQIVYDDAISILQGRGNCKVISTTDISGIIQLQEVSGAESYTLAIGLNQGVLNSTLTFNQAPLNRFGHFIISGELTGDILFTGTLRSPEAAGSLSLSEARLNTDPISFNLDFKYTPASFSLQSFNLTYLNHRFLDGSGIFNLIDGNFNYGSSYRAVHFKKSVSLDLGFRGKVEAPAKQFNLASLFDSNFSSRLTLNNISVEKEHHEDWTLDFTTKNRKLHIDGGPEESIHALVGKDGSFELQLLEPLPIQGIAEGIISDRDIEALFTISHLDMDVINLLTGSEIIKFTAGSAKGRLRITGPFNDPDYLGQLSATDTVIDFALSPSVTDKTSGLLVFRGKSFTLEPVSTKAGSALVSAEGIFYIDHWLPNAFELSFDVSGRAFDDPRLKTPPGLWIKYRFGPVLTDGFARGRLDLHVSPQTIRLQGDILLDSCRIAIDQSRTEEAVEIPISVDLNLKTGKRVEFFWPSINFPVIRTYAKQGHIMTVSTDQETNSFSLSGKIDIRGGEIFYFDRSFYLKEGNISFVESYEEFDPRIKALAEIRERDENNEEIKIYLQVDNRLSQFSPRFFSEPSRPDTEILSLIGGSLANRFQESGFGVSAVYLTSDVVSQFGILRPFERAVREVLKLDLFTIRTQLVQNVLIDKILGEKTIGNVVNPLDNTTLSLGKYLGTDLFLEMVVRFQAANVTESGLYTESRVQTEGEINFEWATPFFLLEWSFAPKHPEDLFLTDNSLGLRWSYSY